MKIRLRKGMNLSSPMGDRISRKASGVEILPSVDCEVKAMIARADLQHHGVETNYRPYIHLTGEIRSVTPDTVLPGGIDELLFAETEGERIDVNHEFTDDELAELVTRKGYFHEGFTVPERMVNNLYEFDTKACVMLLAPVNEEDVPVVMYDLLDNGVMTLDSDQSGYTDLVRMFADHIPVAHEVEVEVEVPEGRKVHDIFADLPLEGREGTGLEEKAEASEVVNSISPDELRARMDEDYEVHRTEVDADLGNVEARPIEGDFDQIKAELEGSGVGEPKEVDPVLPEVVTKPTVDDGMMSMGELDLGTDEDEGPLLRDGSSDVEVPGSIAEQRRRYPQVVTEQLEDVSIEVRGQDALGSEQGKEQAPQL